MVGLILKRREKFGWYQASQRRYNIKIHITNMTKEQADKFESAIRKAALSILPPKDEDPLCSGERKPLSLGRG
jgi:hypothetical protein